MATQKNRLGRGLGALLVGTNNLDEEIGQVEDRAQKSELRKLPIEYLEPGRFQPRKDMNPEALEELSESIKAQGIIQPIVVRQIGEKKFEIIAGERRWRAAQLAGLTEVPVIVKDIPDEAAIAMALIENIQRENLNPIEEANALQRLMEEFEMTHQEVAKAVGKSRTTITNILRLLNLNNDVKLLVEHGDLEMGHARALLGLDKDMQSQAGQLAASKELSVRETESLVRKLLSGESVSKAVKEINPDVKNLIQDLSLKLGADVGIQQAGKGKGKLVIKYNSLDELEGILAHIK